MAGIKLMGLTIDNSKKLAVKSGKWKDPGARFYDILMNAYDNRWVADGRNTLPEEKESRTWHYWQDFLKEAYLKAPVSKITNKGPYGMTPFARSGCKYPHHAIRNGNLVVSVPGLKAAYTRVCQMHELKGDIKEHLERHIKELGIQASFHDGMLSWNEAHEVKIEENFNSIYDYIQENTGIDLHDNYMTEASHGKLKYDFRFGWDYNTGHQVKIVYSLDNIEVTGVGDFYWKYNNDNKNPDGSLKMDEGQYKDWVSKNITRKGNNDHQSKGQKVLAIIDLVTNKKLKSVKLMSPISLDGTEYRFTHYTAIPNEILDEARRLATNNHGISMIKTGEVDNNPSFKSTSWFTNVIDKTTGENLRFNKLAKAEFIRLGRGIKPDDIQAKNFEIKSDPNIRPLLFKNPSKKEALTELYCIEKNAIYWIDIFKYAINNNRYPKGWDYNSTKQLLDQYMNKLKYIKHDISLINAGKYNLSMMQKYKNERMIESAEEEREKYLENNKHVDYIPPSNGIPYYAIPFPEDVEVLESVETCIMEEAINDILDQGGVTPQEVFEWIRSNISYDKASPSEWKLKSPQETYDLKKGNCHDQSLLTFTLFKSMGYKRGQIFFIEYKEGETVGGNTHTFTWYIEDDKYYWFETAWENKAGIHGPYDSIAELKEDVRKEWNNDNDINSRSYSGVYWDGIEFSETSKYKVGMGLGDYVDSWVFVEDIKEAMDWIDNFVNNESFRENFDNISIMQNLPDKLYFSSSVKMDKLTGRVFLTPHIGIASLFIVNLKPVMRDYFAKYADHELTKFNYNSGYEEWNWDNDKLQKPLDMIHINHNVPEYTQVETGSSSGFIHVVDISSVKDQLKTFVTNNPDREVIYEGNETLPIIEVIPHTVNWEINYNESNTIEHGKGFVESYIDNNIEFTEKSHGKLKYDYRRAYDVNTGHQILLVYSLDNIKVSYPGHAYNISNFNGINQNNNSTTELNKINNTVQKNIAKKGNMDHQSYGQKLLAIKDLITGKNLQEVECIGLYQGGNVSALQIINKDAITKAINKGYSFKLKIGDIESPEQKSFKSTKLFKPNIVIDNGIKYDDNQHKMMVAEDNLKHGRGVKMDDISDIYTNRRELLYKHPSKKDIKKGHSEFNKSQKEKKELITEINIMILEHIPSNESRKDYYQIYRLRPILDRIQKWNDDKYNLSKITVADITYDVLDNLIRKKKLEEKRFKNDMADAEDEEDKEYYTNRYTKNIKYLDERIDECNKCLQFLKSQGLIKESTENIHDELNIGYDNLLLPFDESYYSDILMEEVDIEEKNDNPPSISNSAGKESEEQDKESADNNDNENTEVEKDEPQEETSEEVKEIKPLSRPKQTDAAEKDKNGVRRKKLYIAFIEWCKEYNNKNTFGSIFDKDAFNVSYPFVPHEMRYFYRLANPMLCVLSGNLTFFQVAELKKLNSKNSKFPELLIFAATENDLRVFSNTDKKVYFGIEENGEIKLTKVLSDTFDTYIQTMIGKGDILNGPIEDKSEKSES